jgi:EmrB/QacA subfamily drug resistance transporter
MTITSHTGTPAASHTGTPAASLVGRLRGNPWAVLAVISAGFFMILLDLTIVNIAIPSITSNLHASLDQVLWVINGYTLPLAVLLITAGRLGDLRGPRTMFITGVAVFTLASAACGLSVGPAQLIAFRVIQGLGAALLMPQTLTIVTTTFPPQRRGTAMGVWGSVAGAAALAGPTLGGLLVTTAGWRWIFFVNLPVGTAVTVMSLLLIPAQPGAAARGSHRLSLPSVLLATASLLAISYGLVEGPRYRWGTITGFVSIPLVIGVGIALFAGFLLAQARSQDSDPLMPFALFRDRNYTIMTLVSAALAIALIGFFLPLTIYLQSVLAMPALDAGLTIAPMPVMTMLLAPLAGRLADRANGKYILISGLILLATGIGWMIATIQARSHWYDFLPAFILAGTGMAAIFAPMTTMAMRNIPPQLAGAASGLLNTTRQAGSVIGAAAAGALLQNRLAASLTSQAATTARSLPEPIRAHFIARFQNAGSQLQASQPGNTTKAVPAAPHLGRQLQELGHAVFTHGFVTAVRPTMMLPIAVTIAAAIASFAVKHATPAHD